MRSAIVSRRGRTIGLALALLALASCGGGGGSSAPPTPPSKLFFVDAGNHAIVSSVNAAPTLGSTFPINRIVEGSNTGLGLPGGTPSTSTLPSIALDAANDRLYVSTQLNVVVFNGISTADGNVGFSRRFQAAGVNFLGLSLDTLNNLLYTVDPQGVVRIFTGASGLNNTVVPARTLTPDFGSATIVTTFGIAVDNTTNNLLYIGMALNGATSIFVYSNASGVNSPTPVAPDQNLHFAFGLTSFYLDAVHDRLYAAQFDGKILVFDSAHTLTTGTPVPNRTIDLMDGVGHFIFVDAGVRDKLYAVGNNILGNPMNHDLLFGNNASTADDAAQQAPVVLAVPFQDSSIALSAVAVSP